MNMVSAPKSLNIMVQREQMLFVKQNLSFLPHSLYSWSFDKRCCKVLRCPTVTRYEAHVDLERGR